MLAIIGGSGLNQFENFQPERVALEQTPYAKEPVAITIGFLPDIPERICFLPRHGAGHTVPPHRINYRANLYALYQLGVQGILAVNAVGGIQDRKSTRLNSSHVRISYAVFCLKKKKKNKE